jgi:hypothetical protein
VSGLPALDTAIGMVFLYFLLSTACSMINETVANLLGWRAKTLEIAIRNLLGDKTVRNGALDWLKGLVGKGSKPAPAGARNLTDELYQHWRIKALVRDPDAWSTRRKRPSYLPPRAFSLAIAEAVAKGPPGGEDTEDASTQWQQTDSELFTNLEQQLNQLDDPGARALLHKALVNANHSLDGFRMQVEGAFDDTMERASGWYKRKVQVVLVLLAAVIAIGLNVDSVRVASSLWHEGPVRAAVAAQAGEAKDPATAGQLAAEVKELQLPVGWGANRPTRVYDAIPGWLITIAALALGASFWFDLLSRVARLRGSGVPERPRSLNDTAGTVDAGRGITATRVAAQQARADAS